MRGPHKSVSPNPHSLYRSVVEELEPMIIRSAIRESGRCDEEQGIRPHRRAEWETHFVGSS